MLLQPITPLVYEVVEKPTAQTTVSDVLVGAISVVGGLAVVGFLLGVLFAGVLIGLRRLRGQDSLDGGGSETVQLGLTSGSSPR